MCASGIPGKRGSGKPGGWGVFDPGINALSILTYIQPGPLVVRDARLSFPLNCETPIAAQFNLRDPSGFDVSVEFDFLHDESARWDIDIDTDDGHLQLSRGGAILRINGETCLRRTMLSTEIST